MFGYVRVARDVLSQQEQDRFQGVYCGLCRTLGERYGLRAQAILNYEFVFLALLLAEPQGTAGDFQSYRCPVRPWRKKDCWPGGKALEQAADTSVILTWWKLQDAVRDGDWKERTGARAAAMAMKGHYEKAAAFRPEFDALVKGCLEELHELESQRVPSLDRPADTFARILQGAAGELEPGPRASAVGLILYHVGRWIYLVDAWDDWKDDRETGSYNPILARFGEDIEGQREYLRDTLHASLGVAKTAFGLLDWGEQEVLLDHILDIGLPAVEEAVFTGQWKQKQKNRARES